ncbi:Ribosomal S21e [Tubulinosema ratisbonensis]|uniref:Ribosomal S21e n=1 Tax=Tubulinosema ratisbonensis TaxID=291195 RepID=A0A437ANX6_9MICR|nr:Ribosomal S21e [Tubulinosema ratisbonensis]
MAFKQRLCSFTGRPISHTDRSSVQLTFAVLDDDGRATGDIQVFNVSGSIRNNGSIDEAVNEKLIGGTKLK